MSGVAREQPSIGEEQGQWMLDAGCQPAPASKGNAIEHNSTDPEAGRHQGKKQPAMENLDSDFSLPTRQ